MFYSDYFDHKDHIIMTSSYERFSNDAENSDKVSVNMENGDSEKNLEDAHIQIHKADQNSGELKVYEQTDQRPDQFIEDPAGNPFAPKGPLEWVSQKHEASFTAESAFR